MARNNRTNSELKRIEERLEAERKLGIRRLGGEVLRPAGQRGRDPRLTGRTGISIRRNKNKYKKPYPPGNY